MKKSQTGFTLIEMMVVIAIIGILAGALFGGFSYVMKSAQKAKANEAVSNARTALEGLYLKEGRWPSEFLNILKRGSCKFNGYYVMNDEIAKVLFKYKTLSVDCYVPDGAKTVEDYELRGVDRCGIVDPWAQDSLKKASKDAAGSALLSRSVSTGGKVEEHRIYFAVDLDDDGFVMQNEFAPVKGVRAKVITWCAGADGGLGDCSKDKPMKTSVNGRMVANSDNVYSWQRAQEVR